MKLNEITAFRIVVSLHEVTIHS